MKVAVRIEFAAALAVVSLLLVPASDAGWQTHVGLRLLYALAGGQEQQYREREVLDSESDEWVERPEEPQVAPGGELDQMRSRLARGEARKVRKQLQRWLKGHPDDERYYEGVFLLGEAAFECRDFYRAYEHYEQVVENSSGELFRTALRREKDVALAFLSGQKRIVWKILRLPAYDEGIEILDRIWERVPGTQLGEEALRIKADHFFNKGQMDLAQDEYAHLAREYPAGRFVQLAMLRSAVAAEASFPGIRFDDRPLLDAEERYRQLQRAFPIYAERQNVSERLEGIRQSRAEKDLDIARWYQRTKAPEAAEFYYRRLIRDWPDTLAASEARLHLRELGVEPEAGESGQ